MMKETAMTAEQVNDEYAETPQKSCAERLITRWTLVSYVSFTSGILSALAGIILGAESYVGMLSDAGTVNEIANILIIAAFPLMMIGAHSLDKLAELKSPQKNNP